MRGLQGHAAVLLLAVLVGAAGPSDALRRRVAVEVVPRSSLIDEAVHIRLTSLPLHAGVTVRLHALDGKNVVWHASARFRADRHGRVDLDRAKSLAGSYTGVWGMGLVASLTTRAPPPGALFSWNESRALRFRLSVEMRRRIVAATSFHRALWPVGLGNGSPVDVEDEPISKTGFYGRYYAPSAASAQHPGILLFGGSEGGLGLGLIAATLAGRGYPTLALAYFKEPGLPQTLSDVPLEYFATALRWLRGQRQVDASRTIVIGGSRGSEAALLLGVHYPELVQAVVALAPSNIAICSFPACSGPAWTYMGQPVPYSHFFGPSPIDNPDAVIPVERIRGPIMLVCGEVDLVWPSCPSSRAIMNRLDASGDPYAHSLYAYPNAGHYVDALLPYEPYAPHDFNFVGDERAREQAWPRLLSFLAALPPS